MGERHVGRTVGYQVGMASKFTRGVTRVMFMTTGIFLMRLVNNPSSFKNYTHLIMDEVHERDLDIDFSLVVIKHLLGKMANAADSALNFKLVLMSATFNVNLFANYFSKQSIIDIEKKESYAGTQQRYLQEEQQRKQRQAQEWRPAK